MSVREEYAEKKSRQLDESTDRDALMNIARKWMARTQERAIPGTAPRKKPVNKSGRFAPIIRKAGISEEKNILH